MIPVVTKRGRAEDVYAAEILLAYGGAVHSPDKGVCFGKARNRLLKSRWFPEKSEEDQKDFTSCMSNQSGIKGDGSSMGQTEILLAIQQ